MTRTIDGRASLNWMFDRQQDVERRGITPVRHPWPASIEKNREALLLRAPRAKPNWMVSMMPMGGIGKTAVVAAVPSSPDTTRIWRFI